MRVIVDAYGGDNAPDAVLQGCRMAADRWKCEIVLTGIEVASYGVDLPGKPGLADTDSVADRPLGIEDVVQKEASREHEDLSGRVLLADAHLARLELVGQHKRLCGMGPKDVGRGQRCKCGPANEEASGNHAIS